ncbi:MAG: hypothetical protein ABFS03_14090 [Chloroflexota bacterium]
MSYDLRGSRGYKELHGELELFGAVQVLRSAWYFNREGTTAEVMEHHFKALVESDDGLIVFEVGEWVMRTPDNISFD